MLFWIEKNIKSSILNINFFHNPLINSCYSYKIFVLKNRYVCRMNWTDKKSIRVAILDLYEGFANQGMRCIREILNQFGENNNIDLSFHEFEVRLEKQVPDLSYDIYISSGGPGSPIDSE